MKKIIYFIGAAFLLNGCASLTTGTVQNIMVTTGTEEKAVCKLTNDKGEWTVNNTPGSVSVKRSYADLLVVCTKDKKSGTQKVHSQTKGMLAGNILCGGIIGGGIDCASGAAYDYPSTIDVLLK